MPRTTEPLALRVGAQTHPGTVRCDNQDRMGRFPTPLGELFLIADGMGGHQGGAIAAAMTSDGFEACLKTIPPDTPAHDALQQAAQRTNAEIYQRAHVGDPATANMGSTVVLALVAGRQMVIGHAGDSRAYLFRDGQLQRLTHDHSLVQQMLDQHLLTAEEAREHPDAGVITRAFGQQPTLALELSSTLELQAGDGVLLCSDGLCGYVNDTAIERVIRQHHDAQAITNALLDLALATGGADNVTAQFLWCGPPVPMTADAMEKRPGDSWPPSSTRTPRLSRLTLALLLVGAIMLGICLIYALG
jgi:serine/threonine protein phosphatase PrpC